jgi:CRP/FNR family transcriptional regulator
MFMENIRLFTAESPETKNQPGLGEMPCSDSVAAVSLADLASLVGLPISADPRFAAVMFPTRRVKVGEFLYRAGDVFDALYVVRSGCFKTLCVDATGAEQLLAFPMAGDVLGLDGLDQERHSCDAVALEGGCVAVVTFARFARLAHEHPCVERLIYRLFSRELVHERNMIWLLGMLSAESRVAAFLLDLSDRLGRLGYSRTSFILRATRAEIGSYLGLKLETVSRTLSAFAAAGLISVERKNVTLSDIARLRSVVDPNRRENQEPVAIRTSLATEPVPPTEVPHATHHCALTAAAL